MANDALIQQKQALIESARAQVRSVRQDLESTESDLRNRSIYGTPPAESETEETLILSLDDNMDLLDTNLANLQTAIEDYNSLTDIANYSTLQGQLQSAKDTQLQLKYDLKIALENDEDVTTILSDIATNTITLDDHLTEYYAINDPRYLVNNLDDDTPFLLLPIRVETRYMTIKYVERLAEGESSTIQSINDEKELWLRFFPDDIATNTHEIRLTEGEEKSGQHYWTEAYGQTPGGSDEADPYLAAWRALVGGYGPERAAWIVKETEPTNLNANPAPETSDDLIFPALVLKPASWTDSPKSHVMPDRFVVRLYTDDDNYREVIGNSIPDPLILGISPEDDPDTTFLQEDGEIAFPNHTKWLSNFDEATNVGMGLKIALQANEETHLKRILVLGLKLSADKTQATTLFEELIENHHYTTGGFSLIKQGTPTNNTEDVKSGYERIGSDAKTSYNIEQDGPLYTPVSDLLEKSDGQWFADMLGVDDSIIQNIGHADGTDICEAIAMNQALWPATMGYFLKQMMHPHVSASERLRARNFFNEFVSGRGKIPAFKIGNQPYGIIPSTAFTRWTYPSSNDDLIKFYTRLNANFIQPMNYSWELMANEYVKGIDTGTQESAPSGLFMNILTLHASSVEFNQRYANGTFKMWNIWRFMNEAPTNQNITIPNDFPKLEGQEIAHFLTEYNSHLATSMASAPKIFELNFLENDRTLNGPVIDGFEALPYSESRGLLPFPNTEWNYIHWLIDETSTISKIRAEEFDNIPDVEIDQNPPNALLYLLLRHAYLQQYLNTSTSILVDANEADSEAPYEIELQYLRAPGNLTEEQESFIYNSVSEELTHGKRVELHEQAVSEFSNEPETPRSTIRAREEQLFSGAQTQLQTDIDTEVNARKTAYYADQDKWNYVLDNFPGIVTGLTMEEYIDGQHAISALNVADLTEFKNSLDKIKDLPTARLERAFAEHVDLCSHRLDAWMIGLVNQRLETQQSAEKGLYLGSFGMLENLSPSTTLPGVHVIEVDENGLEVSTSSEVSDDFVYIGNTSGADLERDADNGKVRVIARVNSDNLGYVHTPSVNHAVAAAILRAGYLSHQNSSSTDDAFAVNLTSRRVRRALYYLEGIRNGQTLPALMGYRFERELHDISSNINVNLDQYIYNIRLAYPLVPSRSITDDPNIEAQETTEAKNVVDAVALMNAYENDPDVLLTIITDTPDRTAVNEVIDLMMNDMDAIADLLLSESVYQMAKGNIERSGAVLKALGEGNPIQEPEIVRTPRQGHALTNRFGIQFDSALSSPTIWTSANGTARSIGEPGLNGWLSTQLPDPENVIFKVTVNDVPFINLDPGQTPRDLQLDDLNIEPIDFVHFIGDQGQAEDAAELSSRIINYTKTYLSLTDADEIKIQYLISSDDLTGSKLSLLQVLPLVKSLKNLIGNSRPMLVEDYLLPAEALVNAAGDAEFDGLDITAIQTQLKQTTGHGTDVSFADSLKLLVSNLTTDIDAAKLIPDEATLATSQSTFESIRDSLLLAANFGIPSAVPTTVDDITTLDGRDSFVASANIVKSTLANKKSLADAILDDLGSNVKEINKNLEKAGQIIFGRNFKVYPDFELLNTITINSTRANSSLLNGAGSIPNEMAIEEWMQSAAKVRSKLTNYQKVRLFSDALQKTATNHLSVTQLPYRSDDDRWLGSEISDTYSPAGDTLSLVLELPQNNDSDALQAGMIIDEWVETIPDKNVQTGVAMNYDQPNTEAPNSLIMAVTPEATGAWEWDDLMDTLNETLSLAKKRAVEPDHIKNSIWGQALPALIAAISSNDTTPSLDFSRNIIQAPPGQYGPTGPVEFPFTNESTI